MSCSLFFQRHCRGRGWVEVGENVKVLQFMQLSKLCKPGFVICCLSINYHKNVSDGITEEHAFYIR